jgi:hypothetical protein
MSLILVVLRAGARHGAAPSLVPLVTVLCC